MNRDPQRRKSIFLHPVFLIFVGFPALLFGGIFVRALMEPVREQPRPKLFPNASQPAPKPIGNQEAVQVASTFEKALKDVSQNADYVSFVDVSKFGGYAIVHWEAKYSRDVSQEDKLELERLVAKLWRETKWVEDQGWDSWVEFIEHPAGGDIIKHFAPE
ncbi:hypothetical protein [Singulisphaera sp. PoT]|uniref:hypothetical protein n=1 Tax=Singulisphaera sp. PoT TaxID=3411797 RepID=UPI003BF48207